MRAEPCLFIDDPFWEVDTRDTIPGRRSYVDNELCVTGDRFVSTWVYEESNGIEGLQRDDFRSPIHPICDHVGDTFVALVFARAPIIPTIG